MNADANDPHAMADRIVQAGSRPEEIAAALAVLGDDRAAFLSRLAAHAALRDTAGSAVMDDGGAPVSTSLLAHARAAYEAEKERMATPVHPKDLSRLPTWVAAKAAFGDDVTFVIKLAGRHVTTPTRRFVRYAADALGVAVAQVRQHFAEGMPRGVAGAESKSSGKPETKGVEDFEQAVRAAKVPDELRARWLAE